MRIETEVKLDFKDVLIRPKRSTLASRSEVSIENTFTFKHSKRTWTGVPLIASNMDTTGTFAVAKVLAEHKIFTAIHKHYSVDEWKEFIASGGGSILEYLMISTGVTDHDLEKVDTLLKQFEIPTICVDVANGYSEGFADTVRSLRGRYPSTTIVAGNVVTGEMTEELLLAGADAVKVGIGPGSVCTTRRITGVGYPQLSAAIECADAAHGLGGLIISDGGCTCPGDISKAFGAGADFVMLGGMFAGHDESAGEVIEMGGKKYKQFYGMSSTAAMDKYCGGVAEYRASEGKAVLVPYRGSLEGTLREILGGLRSTCTYVGAKSVKELSKRTTFLRVTQQTNPIFNGNETV